MKRIVFISGTMKRGGAERVISLLSKHYAELGWSVKIVTLLHGGVEYELPATVDVIDFSNDKIKASLDIPRLVLKLRSFIRRERPNAVVAFMAPICLISGLACFGLKTRLIVSERNDPALEPRGKLMKFFVNWTYANAARTVMQTERAMNYFTQNIRKNSVIIPNPISVSAYATESTQKRIVTAGRLEPQKNHEMLIAAFSRIHNDYPEYRLDIYGDGSLRDALQNQICELGLSNSVTLLGNVLNIHEEIADSKMFVLSSNFEGLSNALLEAMMMGLPCISTNCAGSDEVILDGENGLIVPIGDTEALELAMRRIINDTELETKMRKMAKATSESFTIDSVIKRWEKVIEG